MTPSLEAKLAKTEVKDGLLTLTIDLLNTSVVTKDFTALQVQLYGNNSTIDFTIKEMITQMPPGPFKFYPVSTVLPVSEFSCNKEICIASFSEIGQQMHMQVVFVLKVNFKDFNSLDPTGYVTFTLGDMPVSVPLSAILQEGTNHFTTPDPDAKI